MNRTDLRRAAAVCRRIAVKWGRESDKRIRGDGDNDDWSEAYAKSAAANECARAIVQLAAVTPPARKRKPKVQP